MARNQSWAGVAARLQIADVIHAQATLLLGLAMTFKTAFYQDRAHLVFEELHRRTCCIIVGSKCHPHSVAGEKEKEGWKA